MVGIVLISHGSLAAGLLAAAEMIMGPQEAVEVIGLGPAENLDEFQDKLRQAARRVDRGGGTLVMVDLFGGSPGNTAAYLAQEGTEVLTGSNLPMLIEALSRRDELDATALAAAAVSAAAEGVRRLREMI